MKKLTVVAHDKESEKIIVELLHIIRALKELAGLNDTLPNLNSEEVLIDLWSDNG